MWHYCISEESVGFLNAGRFLWVVHTRDELSYAILVLDDNQVVTDVLEWLRYYKDVFSEEDVTKLQKLRKVSHPIVLKDGCEPPHMSIYSLSLKQTKVLWEYIKNKLCKRLDTSIM